MSRSRRPLPLRSDNGRFSQTMLLFVNPRSSILGLLALLTVSPASAQSPAVPSMSQNLPPISIGQVTVNAGATFAGSNEPIRSGLVWRIYEDRGDASQPVIVARSTSPAPSFTLSPGNYIIHVAYGFASASRSTRAPSSSRARSAGAPSRRTASPSRSMCQRRRTRKAGS